MTPCVHDCERKKLLTKVAMVRRYAHDSVSPLSCRMIGLAGLGCSTKGHVRNPEASMPARPSMAMIIMPHAGRHVCCSTVPDHCLHIHDGCGWNLAINLGPPSKRVTWSMSMSMSSSAMSSKRLVILRRVPHCSFGVAAGAPAIQPATALAPTSTLRFGVLLRRL